MEADIRDVKVERYYPDVLANSKEFKALSSAVDPELKLNWTALWKQFLNTFVYSLDEDGATRWESMLRLYPTKTDTLETRRKAILAKINSMLPYTERSLQSMLDGVYGVGKIKVNIDYNKYKLWLDVAPDLLLKSPAIRQYTKVIAPANLTMNVSNTIEFKFGLYYGGVVKQTKHVSIYPNGDFNVDIDHLYFVVAGVVRQAKHFTLRS
ncbi:putative phage tail protein [Anaerosinus sp.]